MINGLREAARAQQAGENPYRALPVAAEHVWLWFAELDAARSGNGFGANPISFAEIKAWASLTGRRPRDWEIAALRALDADRVRLLNEAAGATATPADAPPTAVAERPLTPALFDALFG